MIDINTIRFIHEHESDNIRELALKLKTKSDLDANLILRQIAGRQVARIKISTWYKYDQILYPEHISLEQSSSEKTAKYKASLCSGETLVDLTGGLGVDFSFISANYTNSAYIEKNEELANLALTNFEVLGLTGYSVVMKDAEDYLQLMNRVDTIYIDPARRKLTGLKAISIEDCSPDLKEIGGLIDKKSKQAMIKLSPMLDISQALRVLNFVNEIHVISVNNECKELLLLKTASAIDKDVVFKCVNIANNGTIDKYIFAQADENAAIIPYADSIKTYIYEPNASILKAGAFKRISIDYEVDKLHINSHLYTSDKYAAEFPGRKFKTKEVIPFKRKEIKNKLSIFQKANITTRNFPLSIDEIRKKVNLKEGGENYIFATTMYNEEKVLILCEKV